MNAPVLEFEGTWEEVAAHAPELAGQRVRLTVLPNLPKPENNGSYREASGRSLLRHVGTWVGDDFEECREIVYQTRGLTEFRPNIFDEIPSPEKDNSEGR